MFFCLRKHTVNSKLCPSKQDKKPSDKKKVLRDSCLVCGVAIIILISVVLFTFMEDEKWTENSYMRQRILLIGVCLFMASTALCLYVWKSDKKQEKDYLELLVIEKPPSYDSIIFQEPPPAYIAVVKSIHIIQQETTG